jgi:hypothetical protein
LNPGFYFDNSVAYQKKPSLPAHVDLCVAGELAFYGYFRDMHHANALGFEGNV